MTRRVRHVTSCPLCGGILQSTTAEALTSADVLGDTPDARPPRQCLICGYQEPARPEAEPATLR